MKKLLFVFFPLILTACGSNPISYLPSGTTPIVNVEADVAKQLKVEAHPEKLSITNLNNNAIKTVYKLYWYDINGVTQAQNEQWQTLVLKPHQRNEIPLHKPTVESANYRFYLRGQR